MTDTQVEEAAIGIEQMADMVEELQAGAKRMMEAGLNRRAVLLLLSDASGLCMRDVDLVLNGMESLKKRFLSEFEEES